MSVGIMQIVGFAVGGILVTVMSPRGTLLAGAVLYVVSGSCSVRRALARRRAPGTPVGRPDLAEQRPAAGLGPPPLRLHRAVRAERADRRCESLFVSYSPRHAGTLFACTAVGMLAGDTLAGRFVSERWRDRLGPWLRLLLACPYLVFFAHPPLAVACAVCVIASVGYSATLMLQRRLIALTPEDLKGHALGLHSSSHARDAGGRRGPRGRRRGMDLPGDRRHRGWQPRRSR